MKGNDNELTQSIQSLPDHCTVQMYRCLSMSAEFLYLEPVVVIVDCYCLMTVIHSPLPFNCPALSQASGGRARTSSRVRGRGRGRTYSRWQGRGKGRGRGEPGAKKGVGTGYTAGKDAI